MAKFRLGRGHRSGPRQAPRIVHDEARRYPVVLMVIGVVLGVAVLGLAGLDYLQRRAIQHQQDTVETVRRYEEKLAQHRETEAGLRTEIARLQRVHRTDESMVRALKKEVSTLQSTAAELRKRIKFFDAIVNADGARTGVQVQAADLRWSDDDHRRFLLDLVVAQAGGPFRTVHGRLDLRLTMVDGTRHMMTKTTWCQRVGDEDVAGHRGRSLGKFAFKYFEEVSFSCTIPQAERLVSKVELLVKPSGSPSYYRSLYVDPSVDHPVSGSAE